LFLQSTRYLKQVTMATSPSSPDQNCNHIKSWAAAANPQTLLKKQPAFFTHWSHKWATKCLFCVSLVGVDQISCKHYFSSLFCYPFFLIRLEVDHSTLRKIWTQVHIVDVFEDFILPEQQGFSKIPQGETKNKRRLEQQTSTQEHSSTRVIRNENNHQTSSIRIYKLIDVLWNKKVLWRKFLKHIQICSNQIQRIDVERKMLSLVASQFQIVLFPDLMFCFCRHLLLGAGGQGLWHLIQLLEVLPY